MRPQLTQPLPMPSKERLPRRRLLMTLVEQPGGVLHVLLGRIGALDAPQGEVGANRMREALQATLQRPLLTRRQIWVGRHPQPVQAGGLTAPAEEHIALRVTQWEAHGRPSTTCPPPSSV